MSAMRPIEWLMLVLLSIVWGGSFFFSELALTSFHPFTTVFLRVLGAAGVMVAVVYLSGHRLPTTLRAWRPILVLGIINNVIPFCLITWGQTRIDSGTAAILNGTVTIFLVILAHWMTPDEKLTKAKAAGVLVGFGGVYLMMVETVSGGLGGQGLGRAAVLLASLSYALAGIYGKRFKDTPLVVTVAGMLSCSCALMLPLALMIDPPWPSEITAEAVWGVVGQALGSTAIAYLLYFRILATAGATNAALCTFLIPISAVLLGVGLLDEVIGFNQYAGMVLIFSGLGFIDGRPVEMIRAHLGRRA